MSTKDISHELQIQRFANGIKLINPDENSSVHTVSNLMKLPFQVYFEDTANTIISANDAFAGDCRFNSPNACQGEKWHTHFQTKTVLTSIVNNKHVVDKQIYLIKEENGMRNDGEEIHTLSIKMPWYGDENNIFGLFGFSIDLGKEPLADSLQKIAELGYLNAGTKIENMIGSEINNAYLSKRQIDCARLLLSGKTSKEIALSLNISYRTVESYINTIKIKLNCRNKTELILKLAEVFKA